MPADDLVTERLLRVIDEGRRTATYKLALLLAPIDSAAIHPGENEVGTREIAALVMESYYPQVRVYVANDGIEHELRQISASSSPALRAMLRLRIHGEAGGCRNLGEVRQHNPREYAEALDRVEDLLVREPIPRLQTVGGRSMPFLYAQDWQPDQSVRALRHQARDRVRFLDGIPDRLVVLGPLLRPLIELHWTRQVARLNGVGTEDEALRAHLFGADRSAFPQSIRDGLLDLQRGRCFYCDARITGAGEVDHVLAWSRWPNDAIENLVLADRCNNAKREHLLAEVHLRRWTGHVATSGPALVELAGIARWASDPQRSLALVRSTYLHIPPGTPLWLRGQEFEEAAGPIEVVL